MGVRFGVETGDGERLCGVKQEMSRVAGVVSGDGVMNAMFGCCDERGRGEGGGFIRFRFV